MNKRRIQQKLKLINYTKIVVVFITFGFVLPTFAQKDNEVTNKALLVVDSAATTNNTVTSFAYNIEGLNLVFSGGDGAFVDVFSINNTGKLTPLNSYKLNYKKATARGIVADKIGDSHYLFVGNKGGNAVEVFKIEKTGNLSPAFVLDDSDSTYIGTVITLQVIHMKKASFLFVGGLEDTPGLSCFKIHNDGKLSHVQSLKDDQNIHADGIIGMFVHRIKGKTYLFTGGFQDNGVSSFCVLDDGHFKNVSNIHDNINDRYLTGTYPVNGVTLGKNHFLIVGHRHHKYYKRIEFIKKKDFVYHGDGVSVFKINNHGEIIPHHVLLNNDSTKLAGQTRIEVLQTNKNEAIVTIGTRDDNSLQIGEIGKDGILKPSGYLETGYPIYYGVSSLKIGNELFIQAGSVDNKVKKLYSYKILSD